MITSSSAAGVVPLLHLLLVVRKTIFEKIAKEHFREGRGWCQKIAFCTTSTFSSATEDGGLNHPGGGGVPPRLESRNDEVRRKRPRGGDRRPNGHFLPAALQHGSNNVLRSTHGIGQRERRHECGALFDGGGERRGCR